MQLRQEACSRLLDLFGAADDGCGQARLHGNERCAQLVAHAREEQCLGADGRFRIVPGPGQGPGIRVALKFMAQPVGKAGEEGREPLPEFPGLVLCRLFSKEQQDATQVIQAQCERITQCHIHGKLSRRRVRALNSQQSGRPIHRLPFKCAQA